MIRSFTGSFEKLLRDLEKKLKSSAAKFEYSVNDFKNVRTDSLAITPAIRNPQFAIRDPQSLTGTFLTGEMFAPFLREQMEKLNLLLGSKFFVKAVPNTYFGGDVSVAGLLTGQDFLAVKDQIKGDFVVIPKHTIKSDEPILLDGMQFADLQAKFNVPIYAMDAQELISQILIGKLQK